MDQLQSRNGLSITDKNTMPAIVQEIFDVLDTKTVSSALPPEIFNAIKPGYYKAYADTGFKMAGTAEEIDQNAVYQITEIMRYVNKKYPGMRLGEIAIAFGRGTRKSYGDYMGLSVISFCGFLDGYVNDQDRQKALIALNKPREEPKAPDYHQVFDIAKSNALNALQEVKTAGDVGLSAGVVYDFLEKIGLIVLDNEEKKQIFDEAKQSIMADLSNRVEVNRLIRARNKQIIEALLDIEKPQDSVKHMIKNKAKAMALRSFLEGVLFEELDFDVLIEEKRKEGEL